MKRLALIFLSLLLSFVFCSAQSISDSGYRTVGFIKSDGTVQDSGYRPCQGRRHGPGCILQDDRPCEGYPDGVGGIVFLL